MTGAYWRLSPLIAAASSVVLLAISFLALPAAAAQPAVPSGCDGTISITMRAGPARACEQVPVSVTFDTECPVCPGGLNAVFVLLGEVQVPAWQASESRGVLDALEQFALSNKVQHVNIAVIHYDGDNAVVVQGITDHFARVRGALNARSGYVFPQAVVPAANEAVRQLRLARGATAAPEHPCELVVMFAHSKPDRPEGLDLLRAADVIRREVDVFLVGCPIDNAALYCQVAPDMPPSRRYYSEFPENRMAQVARSEVGDWNKTASVHEVVLFQHLAPGLQFLDGSASVPPGQVVVGDTGTRLTWRWDTTAVEPPPSVTYGVMPMSGGAFTLTGSLQLTDSDRHLRSVVARPTPELLVEGECPAPTPTAFASRTPIDRASATAPPVPTATAAAERSTLYLPVLLREECDRRHARADVVLVIDASTSMLEPVAADASTTKLQAAIAAAGAFLDHLALDAGDQAAIVSFNADARLEQPLTSDRVALDAASARIRTAPQTCLVCGISYAGDELASDRRTPSNRAVMILLTDGRSNPRPVSEAEARAEVAKRDGVTIFTIGLGDELDAAALERIASTPEWYYHAPSAAELGDIYALIALEIPCPADDYWGGR